MLAKNISAQSLHQPKKKRWLWLLLIPLTIGSLFLVFHIYANPETRTPTITKTPVVQKLIGVLSKNHAQKSSAPMNEGIVRVIAENPQVDISVSAIDLKTGGSFSYGDSKPFVGASVTKLLTALCALNESEKGNLSLTESLGDYPISWHLKQLVNQSNNDSWALLNSRVGVEKLINYSDSIGASSFDYYSNSVSATDVAKLLSELYSGKLLNSSDTKLLLSYMQNTNNEDLIPGGVPQGVTVYHKYGDIDYSLHDATIVEAKNPFVLVVFTSSPSSMDYDQRENIIHRITSLVCDYENSD